MLNSYPFALRLFRLAGLPLLLCCIVGPASARAQDVPWKDRDEQPSKPVSSGGRSSSSRPSSVDKQQPAARGSHTPRTAPRTGRRPHPAQPPEELFQQAIRDGNAAYEAGRYTQAEAHYLRAQKLYPYDHRPFIGLGNIYYVRGVYAEAAKRYNQAIRLQPNYVWYEVYFYLGNAYYYQRRYADAVKVYQFLTRTAPDDAGLFYNLGLANIYLRSYPEAATALRRVIELQPANVSAYYWLGGAHYFQGDYEETIELCKKAASLNPSYSRAYYGMGLAYIERNKKNEAMQQYRVLQRLDPQRAERLLSAITRRFGVSEQAPAQDNVEHASRQSRPQVEHPSASYRTYSGSTVFRSISVPSNWRNFDGGNIVTFAPQGAYSETQGRSDYTHGVMVGIVKPQTDTLLTAARQSVNSFLEANPHLQPQSRDYESSRIDNHQALVMALSGVSNVTGSLERVTVYTTMLRDGNLFYLISIVPDYDYDKYRQVFQRIVNSIHLNDTHN
ncbi:MAG TPA: tetratricopeptide repeat protein [Pyrinomonadaceae bacterium]|jgi:tetratricopeptide (TPR) repeat protein